MGIKKKLGILVLSLTLILVVSTPTRAGCYARGSFPWDSTTCYYHIGPVDSGKWLIAVSKSTLTHLATRGDLSCPTIRNVLRVMEQNKIEMAGFFYRQDLANKLAAQECVLYAMRDDEVMDNKNVVMPQYTADCVYDAADFAFRVSMIIEEFQEEPPDFLSFVSVRLAGHELAQPRKSYRFGLSTLIANSAVMRKYWKTEKGMAQAKKLISYPVVRYKIKEGDSLWNIAAESTDSALNWSTIWAFNSDKIKGARDLVPGKTIVLPARIDGWSKITKADKSAHEISIEQYGTDRLTDFVQAVCEAKISSGDEQSCLLPKFTTSDLVADVYVGRISKREEPM